MPDNLSFYCLGAAHTDIKAHALTNPKLGDSVPVMSRKCLGGVACNLAVNLAHCGAKVALASLVGEDPEGHALIRTLALNNIDTKDILFSKLSPTAKYYALLTPEGELFVAMADMSIYDELSPELISSLIYKRSSISDWVIDANISGQTIKLISNNIKSHQRLWGIGVSAHKIKVLASGFPNFYGLILNLEELFALTNTSDLKEAMRVLRREKCSRIVVTAGALGVYYCDGKNIGHQKSSSTKIIDVTGAGDAFSAGVIYGLAKGHDFEEAIDLGFKLATKIIRSTDSSLLI
jgi:pseudouridine kinase